MMYSGGAEEEKESWRQKGKVTAGEGQEDLDAIMKKVVLLAYGEVL